MAEWPVYGTIDGPIVMIGFGSIGKGTLPLIERHFEFDKSRMVVVDPDDTVRALLDQEGIRFAHVGLTPENLPRGAHAAVDRRRRHRLLRQPVGRHLVAGDHEALPRARRSLYRHRGRALAGLLFRHLGRAGSAHQQRAEDHRARREGEEPGRHHRRLLLRRQSRHGLLVRQAGAGQPRRRSRPRLRRAGARRPRGLGAADARSRRQGRPHRRARHPALDQAQAARRLRQHLVGGRLHVGGHAAGRDGLGHARDMAARERPPAQAWAPRRRLSAPARRQYPRQDLVPDAGAAIRLSRHPQRVDLDRRFLHAS